MSKPLKWTLASAGIISVLLPLILSFWKAVWVDPAVILVEMERIAEGYVPYQTMHLNYPPLWFYMMVGLKKLFGIPYGCYNFYLSVHYVFLFSCACFVYGISREFGTRKYASVLASWLTWHLLLWLVCFFFVIFLLAFVLESLRKLLMNPLAKRVSSWLDSALPFSFESRSY